MNYLDAIKNIERHIQWSFNGHETRVKFAKGKNR